MPGNWQNPTRELLRFALARTFESDKAAPKCHSKNICEISLKNIPCTAGTKPLLTFTSSFLLFSRYSKAQSQQEQTSQIPAHMSSGSICLQLLYCYKPFIEMLWLFLLTRSMYPIPIELGNFPLVVTSPHESWHACFLAPPRVSLPTAFAYTITGSSML